MTVRIALLACVLGVSHLVVAAPFLTPEMVKANLETQRDSVATDPLPITLDIGKNVRLVATFEVTSKGNGGIDWDGGFLRLYDSHGDGVVFDNYLLNNELVDIDGDGFKDIVVWGVAVLTDDDDREIGRIPVVSILHFNAKTRRFEVTLSSEHIYIELQSNQPLHPTPSAAEPPRRG